MAVTGLGYFNDGSLTPSTLHAHHHQAAPSPTPKSCPANKHLIAVSSRAQQRGSQPPPSTRLCYQDADSSNPRPCSEPPNGSKAESQPKSTATARPISPYRKASPYPQAILTHLPGSPVRAPASPHRPNDSPSSPPTPPPPPRPSPPRLQDSAEYEPEQRSLKRAKPSDATSQPESAKRSHSSAHDFPSHPPTTKTAPAKRADSHDSQVKVPQELLDNMRYLMSMTPRINLIYLASLNQPEDVIEATFKHILSQRDGHRILPSGKVIRKYRGGRPQADFIWKRGLDLPHDDPYNLWALSRAARSIYTIRRITDDNLVAAEPAFADHWGRDVDHEWLPIIIPHPDPPPVPADPRSSKAFGREWRAFKWMYEPTRPSYGWAHFYTLRLHDAETYGIVKEFAKAESLRNVLMSITGCDDHREALRRCAYERREAERGSEPRWKW